MARTVFALMLVQTSQGWVEPACPLAVNDIPEDELDRLQKEGKVVSAEHDSPLAARAHEIRRSGDQSGAATLMQDAARTLESTSAAPEPKADAEQHEPTSGDNSPQTTAEPTAHSHDETDPSKSPTDDETQHGVGQQGDPSTTEPS